VGQYVADQTNTAIAYVFDCSTALLQPATTNCTLVKGLQGSNVNAGDEFTEFYNPGAFNGDFFILGGDSFGAVFMWSIPTNSPITCALNSSSNLQLCVQDVMLNSTGVLGFGSVVLAQGDLLLVGASGDGPVGQGSVYIYGCPQLELCTDPADFIVNLIADAYESGRARDQFGAALDMAFSDLGFSLVVGAPGTYAAVQDGKTYQYACLGTSAANLTGCTLESIATSATGTNFGFAVALEKTGGFYALVGSEDPLGGVFDVSDEYLIPILHTQSATASATVSATESFSASATRSATPTYTYTASVTASYTQSYTRSSTFSHTHTATATHTSHPTPTQTPSASGKVITSAPASTGTAVLVAFLVLFLVQLVFFSL